MDSASLEFLIKQEISHELDQDFESMDDLPPQSPLDFEYNAMNNLINLKAQQNFANSCGYPPRDFMNWNNLVKNTCENDYFNAGDLKFLYEFLDSDVKMDNNVSFEVPEAISTDATITTTTFSTIDTTNVNAAAATVVVTAAATNTTVATTAAAVNATVNATSTTTAPAVNPIVNTTCAANAAAVKKNTVSATVATTNTPFVATVAAANHITANATFAAAATYAAANTTVAATSAPNSNLPVPSATVRSSSVVRSMQPQHRAVLSDTSMESRVPALSRTIFPDSEIIRRVPPQTRTIFPAPSIIRQVPPSPVMTIPEDTSMVIREMAPVKAEMERKAIMRRPPMGRYRKSALLKLEDIQKHFGMPIIKAAKEMKVGLTVLKKRCRELNITRWPHRKIKSLRTLIDNVRGMGLELREIEMLEEHRKLVERLPHLELTERAKKLRQACFKDSYKKRKSMGRV